jgi:hypothetical protein
MENRIIHVENDSYKRYSDNTKTFVVILDGEKIDTWDEYLDIISEKLCFPDLFKKYRNIDAYLDWIRDLSWIEAEAFVVIIKNYKAFFSEESLQEKNSFEINFKEAVLSWWEEDVERCVVEGKAKPFNLILID